MSEDLRLLDGGRGHESEVPAHPESPTWIVNAAFQRVEEVARNALAAYMKYCAEENLPHSYLLGLDILVTGEMEASGKKVVDIRPTILEGPCCNSYPACPNIDSYRLWRRAGLEKQNPDLVSYPTPPAQILDHMVAAFQAAWKAKGGGDKPVIGLISRPYPESEEETAHNIVLEACRKAGLEAHRITPEESPKVVKGKLTVGRTAIDVCYRRIERIHVPLFYGEVLGKKIIHDATETLFINPWKVDDLRSKTKEEACFRRYEAAGGAKISRPSTLMGKEITPEAVGSFMDRGGFALKMWNSTGGKGVFLHVNMDRGRAIYERLYTRFDGRHMVLLSGGEIKKSLETFKNFKDDAAIQQLRVIDARPIDDGRRLVYDTRINVLYDALKKEWRLLSGISRCVPCGKEGDGNSLLTNVSSGANISPLILGTAEKIQAPMRFGPLLDALNKGQTEWKL